MARPKKENTEVIDPVQELDEHTASDEAIIAELPKRVTRETRTPVSGPRDILTVTFKDPNYFYRWVKDFPGRIQRFENAGYEIVVDQNARVGQRTVDSGSRLGSAVTRLDGANVLVLMRIPLEWYNEDQESKQRELDLLEETLKGEGLRAERSSTWQPGDGEFAGKRAK